MHFSCSSQQTSIISRNPDPQIQFETNPLLLLFFKDTIFKLRIAPAVELRNSVNSFSIFSRVHATL